VAAVASSSDSFLVAASETVTIYDSQSGDIMEAISFNDLTRFQISIDGDKILLAGKNSGYAWDLTRKMPVQNIDYNGDCATFSPSGTCVASIYGNFLKIWRTQTGYKNASTQLHNEEIDEVHFSPDEWLVAFTCKSTNRCQILDTTTSLSLFAFDDATITIKSCSERKIKETKRLTEKRAYFSQNLEARLSKTET